MDLEPIQRMSRDIVKASRMLTDQEARYLVDLYYQMQDGRIRSANQLRSMKGEPTEVLQWVNVQMETLENQIKRGLDSYAEGRIIGRWVKSVYGIGPVLSAGLIANIDINQAPTVGHIWSFAGLDPRTEWKKGEKRPWNASLKTLCWKVGQSFMKFSNRDDCYYGKLYRERKAYEIERNEKGGNAETAATLLPKFKKTTESHKHYAGGKLPPAQIDARARRWAVKMFLSHLHHQWYRLELGKEPPKPFAISHLGHAHEINPPD